MSTAAKRTFTTGHRLYRLRRTNQAPDMAGQVVGEFTVVARAPSVNANARWRAECPAGHVRYFDGSYLRRPGIAPRCRECASTPGAPANE